MIDFRFIKIILEEGGVKPILPKRGVKPFFVILYLYAFRFMAVMAVSRFFFA